jgi:hypothetical protein
MLLTWSTEISQLIERLNYTMGPVDQVLARLTMND